MDPSTVGEIECWFFWRDEKAKALSERVCHAYYCFSCSTSDDPEEKRYCHNQQKCKTPGVCENGMSTYFNQDRKTGIRWNSLCYQHFYKKFEIISVKFQDNEHEGVVPIVVAERINTNRYMNTKSSRK